LSKYFSQSLLSAMRIRKVLIPACLKYGTVTRDQLKIEFVNEGLAESESQAGYSLASISSQLGHEKNDFLRQIIKYDYPKYEWEKDDYSVNPKYADLVKVVINKIDESDRD